MARLRAAVRGRCAKTKTSGRDNITILLCYTQYIAGRRELYHNIILWVQEEPKREKVMCTHTHTHTRMREREMRTRKGSSSKYDKIRPSVGKE